MSVLKSLSALLPYVVALVGLSAPLLLSAMEGDPPAGAEFIIVTPPWESASARILRSGGLVLSEGRLPFLALTFAHDADLPARLRGSGAVLFMKPGLESVLCT